MSRTLLVAVLVVSAVAMSSGCLSVASSVASCLPEGQSGRTPQGCRSVRENYAENAAREEQERVNDDRDYKSERGEREHRAAIGADCDGGKPHACLSAAVFDERHGVALEQVLHEYSVACRGNLSFGCLGVARLTDDRTLSVHGYWRACTLGEKQACEAGAAIAPERAAEFDAAACELRSAGACERAAFAFLYGAGVGVDRDRATTLAARGCKQQDSAACVLRDELAAGSR